MIYLDYNASTPIDPAVYEAMLPYLSEHYGNPSSSHAMGRAVKAVVETARGQVANLLGAKTGEIVFTASGTEANNLVIKGVAETLRHRGNHIITSAVEHPAVINPCKYLERHGFEVSYVGVDSNGRVNPKDVAGEVRPNTILVSIMHAQNEVGTIQPIREIAAIAAQGGIGMHTDAAQSCGKVPTRVDALGVDFLSIAGHKLHAPIGVGALYIREAIEIEPLLHGAGHEDGRRAGTEAVAMIVGLGVAAELAAKADHAAVTALRDRFCDGLTAAVGDQVVLLGDPDDRLPSTAAVAFPGRIGAEILAACPEICATTGAACHTESRKRSATLAAMDVPERVAFGAVRFSVGRFTTEAEVDAAIGMVVAAVRSLPSTG